MYGKEYIESVVEGKRDRPEDFDLVISRWKLGLTNRGKRALLADILIACFSWQDQPEGLMYWSNIHRDLKS